MGHDGEQKVFLLSVPLIPALPAPALFVVTALFNPLFILGIEALVSYFLKERM